MRIESVRIENFRVFKDVTIPMNPYTCFVGPNGAGKSTVINALNIFFREKTAKGGDLLTEEDFHRKCTDDPIRITVTFCDLSPEAQEDFKHYFRHGKLVVSAEASWDPSKRAAEVRQYGQRQGMESFKPFFAAHGGKINVGELKAMYESLRAAHPDLPAPGTKDAMAEALRNYEQSHADELSLIPSEDQFYGVSKGENRLAKHVQWVYVPAVKDASDEEVEAKNTALGKLLARTVRARSRFAEDVAALRERVLDEYNDILQRNQGALEDISDSLARRLAEWAHPDVSLSLQWQSDPQNNVKIGEPVAGVVAGEGGFSGSLSRFGHGLQRSYLLTILHELSGCDDTEGPRLILACEEPELFQHPPQIRHLASVLQQLTEQNNQVLVCTHSPAFVSGECFEDVRMVRKSPSDGCSTVSYRGHQEIASEISAAMGEAFAPSETGALAKINQALQPFLNEIFFAPVIILVEGLEDVAHITTYLMLMDRWNDFRRYGCHIVAANGKDQMIMPLAVARSLGIPVFVLFDADSNTKEEHIPKHEKDNKTLIGLMGLTEPAFPSSSFWSESLIVWKENIGLEVKASFDSSAYCAAKERTHNHFSGTGGLAKNSLFIARLLATLWAEGQTSAPLIRLCEHILSFARTRAL